MSASYWLYLDERVTGGEAVQIWDDGNITYNLGPMLRAAGFPTWDALQGAPASEVGGMLRKVRDTLLDDRAKYEAYNPPNGWGDLGVAVSWLNRFADACARYPKATVGAGL